MPKGQSVSLSCSGAGWISQALKEHTNERLVELDLGYNEIKDEGACAVAQVGLVDCTHIPTKDAHQCLPA